MNEKMKMSLVQAEVTFKVRLSRLVETDFANDIDAIEEWFEDQAFKQLYDGDDGVDVDYENQVDVIVSKETAEKHIYTQISSSDWKAIVQESKGE